MKCAEQEDREQSKWLPRAGGEGSRTFWVWDRIELEIIGSEYKNHDGWRECLASLLASPLDL